MTDFVRHSLTYGNCGCGQGRAGPFGVFWAQPEQGPVLAITQFVLAKAGPGLWVISANRRSFLLQDLFSLTLDLDYTCRYHAYTRG